jgi:hypothetical protein
LSGKKYFSDYVSSRLLKRKVISIDPTIENKLIGKSFEKSISNVFQNELSVEENLKDSSAVTLVFNDIDKWGTDIKILERIKDLVIEFGKKHHFILNCSVDFYSYLKQVCAIDEVIISTIIILPIRKDGFIETMKLKHQAGGIKFSLNNKKEKDFSFSQLQSFYQKYHSVYNGNLGRAFLGWVNNIQSVEEGLIYIKEPKSTFFPDISNPDWIVILKLFVLHKEISLKQLEVIFGGNFAYKSILNQMKRIRLIEEPKNGVYSLSEEVFFNVNQYLKDKKII